MEVKVASGRLPGFLPSSSLQSSSLSERAAALHRAAGNFVLRRFHRGRPPLSSPSSLSSGQCSRGWPATFNSPPNWTELFREKLPRKLKEDEGKNKAGLGTGRPAVAEDFVQLQQVVRQFSRNLAHRHVFAFKAYALI